MKTGLSTVKHATGRQATVVRLMYLVMGLSCLTGGYWEPSALPPQQLAASCPSAPVMEVCKPESNRHAQSVWGDIKHRDRDDATIQ